MEIQAGAFARPSHRKRLIDCVSNALFSVFGVFFGECMLPLVLILD